MPSEFPLDSSGNGYFPAVHPVSVGTTIASSQQKRFARAINARLLSGLGDMHWRALWAAHSMVRTLRNNIGGTPYVFAAEDEWWRWYGLYKETNYIWPGIATGSSGGLNQNCPIVAYFFGNVAGTIETERERKSDNVPLRDGLSPAPSTVLEIWDLGKDQRGSILPSDLTDYSYAYALYSARILDGWTFGSYESKQTTAGGRTTGTDPELYYRRRGEQWNQMRTYFLSEWRGTSDERNDDPLWQPSDLTVDYEGMLESQYFLAPSYGTATGSAGATVAEYPLFEWALTATAGTYGTVDATDNKSNATSFSFAGYIAVGENLTGDKQIAIEIDGVTVHTFNLTVAEPEESIWFPVPHKGNLKAKLLTTLAGSEDVWVEVAHLMDFKPDIVDLALFIRLATTRSGSPTIYRGKIVSDAWELSDGYFENGMILNTTYDQIYNETYIAKYPAYQAWRDFILKWFRIVGYKSLKGYYVNGDGNSVLVFDRRGEIAGILDDDADLFQKMAPQVDTGTGNLTAIGNNSIEPDVLYIVKASGGSPSGTITYNGKAYAEDETFRGTYLKSFDATGATDLSVYEEAFIVDIDDITATGQSNEWIMSIGGQTLYDTSGSGTYKEDAYGDILGAFHDRCHTFSEAWVGGGVGDEISKYASNVSSYGAVEVPASPTIGAAPSIMQRAETPPGYRYDMGEVPYYGMLNGNSLITAADDPLYNFDCQQTLEGGAAYDSSYLSGRCDGTIQHYHSCQVYKQPYTVKSFTVHASNAFQVEVELNGRLSKNPSAPSSIADTAASRATYLSTDTEGRSDENTAVALLSWKVDSVDDPERIGDIAASAKDAISGGDYNPSNIDGGALCRFFFQRLMPQVYNDNDACIQQDRDRRAYADLHQYAEFLIRSGVSGFLDEETVLNNTTYNPTTTYCEGQESYDLTMDRLMELVEGTTDHDKLPIRTSDDKRGFGVLPRTKMRADTWTEMGQALNLLKSARFGVPVYLESRTITKWDVFPADVQTEGHYQVVRNWAFQMPFTVRTDTGWLHKALPFQDSALAYSTIWSDASGTNILCYWREIHWRVRVHPMIIEAVPESLRFAAQDASGLGIPVVIERPTRWRCNLRDASDPVITTATKLTELTGNSPECDISNSGIIAPVIPPTSDIVASAAYSGSPGGTVGDAEHFSDATIGTDSLAETYIRVPVK